MSVPFPEICGPSYQLENKYAAIERTKNWYLMANESMGEGKFKISLAPCPGTAVFGTVPSAFPFPARGRIECRGKVFGVNGSVFFELFADGSEAFIGNVVDDGLPASMVATGNNQIVVASGGNLYVWDNAGAFTTVLANPGAGPFYGASTVTFQDGYCIVSTPDKNQIQISGDDTTPIGDPTIWSAANISYQAGQADTMQAVLSSREYVRLFGNRRSQVYTNVGNSGLGQYPFQNYNQTFIETGLAARFSVADLGDSLIWIGQDSRGQRACWRDSAFQPQRVSTFAVEQFWDNYPTIDDAVAFPMIWRGHLIYQISFPTAKATWWYDATVSELIGRPIWTERTYTDYNGQEQARSEQFHCYAFGKHLVGSVGIDGAPGVTWQLTAPNDSTTAFVDQGDTDGSGTIGNMPIVRDRITPHIWGNNKRIIYNRLEVEPDRGTGLDVAAGQPGYDPRFWLRWSNDGGNTWGAWCEMPTGKLGERNLRVLRNRLGYARDRVYWLRFSDPCYMGIIAAEQDFVLCES